MMHIVFDAQPLVDNGKTGVGYCEAGIVTALQSQYTEHDYMFNYFAFRDAREKAGRLRQFVRGDSRSRVCAWFDESLYRILWNFVPVPYRWFFGKSAQITHFFNYHVPPGVPGKTVATVHDMSYKAFPETVRFKTRFMLNLSLRRSCRRADKILTDSEFSKAEIIKYLKLSEDKLVVCPCGVDHRMYRPSADRQEIARIKEKYGIHGDYFLYLGMLEPRKNIERLLEAYAILKKERPDAAALVLAGRKGWLYDSIFTRASALELNDNVLFTGYVDDGDKPPLLRGALAFVFPSLYEGFGLPPLEAMACGTPVLTSNAASLPEVVGDAALLVDPGSVDEIAAGLTRLWADEALREELSRKGLERARRFTWGRAAEIVMDVYTELAGEHNAQNQSSADQ